MENFFGGLLDFLIFFGFAPTPSWEVKFAPPLIFYRTTYLFQRFLGLLIKQINITR